MKKESISGSVDVARNLPSEENVDKSDCRLVILVNRGMTILLMKTSLTKRSGQLKIRNTTNRKCLKCSCGRITKRHVNGLFDSSVEQKSSILGDKLMLRKFQYQIKINNVFNQKTTDWLLCKSVIIYSVL